MGYKKSKFGPYLRGFLLYSTHLLSNYSQFLGRVWVASAVFAQTLTQSRVSIQNSRCNVRWYRRNYKMLTIAWVHLFRISPVTARLSSTFDTYPLQLQPIPRTYLGKSLQKLFIFKDQELNMYDNSPVAYEFFHDMLR
jgi:hypothetical protein